jgi:hypothetical protein
VLAIAQVNTKSICLLQEKEEDGGRGRFKSHTTGAVRIADREKKAPLKQ